MNIQIKEIEYIFLLNTLNIIYILSQVSFSFITEM